jgi:eukaryotic translation initiation factor 4E transporter
MQNALIRKKLEEQRENFRKRQEQEQKEQMQKQETERKHQQDPSEGSMTSPAQSPDEMPKGGPLDSPIKKASGVPPAAQQQMQRQHAPSPNIFTPTSVLRKMTAEKEGDGNKMGSEKKKAITGAVPMRTPQQQQQQQQQQQFMGNLAHLDRMMQLQAQNDAFGKVNWDAQSSLKPQGKYEYLKRVGKV